MLAQAIRLADEAIVHDDSRLVGPQVIAMFSGGDPVGVPHWPDWAPPESRAVGMDG